MATHRKSCRKQEVLKESGWGLAEVSKDKCSGKMSFFFNHFFFFYTVNSNPTILFANIKKKKSKKKNPSWSN